VCYKDFFGNFGEMLTERLPIVALMNLAFFGSILITAFLTQSVAPPSEFWEPPNFFPLPLSNVPLLVVTIFLFNLVVGAFVLLTLMGMVLFVIPAGVLIWRGWLWSSLISQLSTSSFLLVLPTLVLEGEGYVLASVAGTVLGLSWLKPSLIFGGGRLSRVAALMRALKEMAHLYVAVAIILLIAALVEALTLAFLA
jgi:hypothetical protein